MSDRSLVRARGLDAPSRRALTQLAFEVTWFAAISAAPVFAGFTSAVHAVASFGTYCSFGALLRVVIAARRRERPGGPSLTNWDHGLALAATAMLAYAVSRMMTG